MLPGQGENRIEFTISKPNYIEARPDEAGFCPRGSGGGEVSVYTWQGLVVRIPAVLFRDLADKNLLLLMGKFNQ
jgi:hypothetical protein